MIIIKKVKVKLKLIGGGAGNGLEEKLKMEDYYGGIRCLYDRKRVEKRK